MTGSNASPHRGSLTVILGYAAGVGKTCRMLDEGRRLKNAGRDVVVGFLETHGRKQTAAKADGLEIVPRKPATYHSSVFLEMDIEAVVTRHPQICLVDEFAHTNIPGSARTKRWEDVHAILDAGIDVLTTLNVQHLESLNDQVQEISGVKVQETVPDWVVDQADEIVVVDVTPTALINRLKRGAVYEPQAAQQALENFFKESTLNALRELALRQAAHEVEAHHQQAQDQVAEKVLVHVTSDPLSSLLIRRGRRIADHLRMGFVAVVVAPDAKFASLTVEEREAVRYHLNLARRLHAETRVLVGGDVAAALIGFAKQECATHILLIRPASVRRRLLSGEDQIARLVRMARGIRVTFVAPRHRQPSSEVPS